MKKIINHLKTLYPKYLISLFIILITMLLYVSIRGEFLILVFYINGLVFGGLISILIGGLSFVTYHGAFNIFTYAFSSKYSNGTRKTLADYNDEMIEKRKTNKFNCLPYIITGVIMILLAYLIYLFI